ncbi:MAG: glycosyltransferase [Magnetococcus sp. MYC-9]
MVGCKKHGRHEAEVIAGTNAMDNESPTFSETMARLDATGDVAGLVQHVCSRPFNLAEVLTVMQQFLGRARLRSAFVLAMLLAKNGYQHWLVSVALSFGGLIYNRPEEEARGMALLQAQMDALPSPQQEQIYLSVLNPVMIRIIEQHLVNKPGETPPANTVTNPVMARMVEHHLANKSKTCENRPLSAEEWWRLLEICKATIPPYRTWFDWQAPVPVLTLETLRQQGRARAQLIRYPLPAADAPRPRRRVVVFMRDFYIPRRIAVGMEAYGWDVAFHGTPGWSMSAEDIRAVLERCRQQDIELLALHFDQILGKQAQAIYELLLTLRQEKPSLKIVVTTCDIWALRKDMINDAPDRTSSPFANRLITLFDAIWASDAPSLSALEKPPFAGRALHLHIPHAGTASLPDRPLVPRMLYIGSEVEVRYSRKFFLMTAERLGLPVEQKDHFFVPSKNLAPLELLIPEGLSSLDSYARHMQRLQEATCCLHFSRTGELYCMRHGMVTHRSFEVPLSGALLVQEFATDMSRFFVPGEHYLEFNSVAELAAIARFITERPEEAEEIRRSGNAFAREHYGDDKLIGYLDKFLWP